MKFSTLLIFLTIFGYSSAYAESLRIEAIELSKTLSNFKVLDTRAEKLYSQGHIENSLNFPVDLSYDNKMRNGRILQPDKMQTIIRDLGLNIEDSIIIYDDGSFFNSTRLFWTLEVYGFLNIKILNTGFEQWKRYGFQTSTELTEFKKSDYIASVNNKRLATKFTTQIAIKNPNYVILDARGEKAYNGEISMAQRFGHIPKALYFPANNNIDINIDTVNKLKTKKDLAKVYSQIKKGSKVIVYCTIGKVATTNYFALRELGYDVANYDSSWREWGNDLSLPIITPAN